MSAVARQRTCLVQGQTISYREAGDVSAPAILLLHGLLGSSAEYDTLIRALADKFHLIAPDYIGFGASKAPEPGVFASTFENLTDYVAGLIEAIGLQRYVLYMHDCGRPVGFRLFARAGPGHGFHHPERQRLRRGGEHRLLPRVRAALGETDARDRAGRCGQKRSAPATSPRLIDLLEDYRTNVALYPDWQATFREHLPPTLIIWGKHDPVFIPPGARAYLADLPQAKLVWLDAGHSALDQNSARVAAENKAAFVPRAAVPAIELIARQRAARMYPSLTAR